MQNLIAKSECKICSRLKIEDSRKISLELFRYLFNFKHIVHLFLMFLSLTLTICLPAGLSKIIICDRVFKL